MLVRANRQCWKLIALNWETGVNDVEQQKKKKMKQKMGDNRDRTERERDKKKRANCTAKLTKLKGKQNLLLGKLIANSEWMNEWVCVFVDQTRSIESANIFFIFFNSLSFFLTRSIYTHYAFRFLFLFEERYLKHKVPDVHLSDDKNMIRVS